MHFELLNYCIILCNLIDSPLILSKFWTGFYHKKSKKEILNNLPTSFDRYFNFQEYIFYSHLIYNVIVFHFIKIYLKNLRFCKSFYYAVKLVNNVVKLIVP